MYRLDCYTCSKFFLHIDFLTQGILRLRDAKRRKNVHNGDPDHCLCCESPWAYTTTEPENRISGDGLGA